MIPYEPLLCRYLSAVEDRIGQEIIPNVDAWVEATGGGGGDVDVGRAARNLRRRLDQLSARLDALQNAYRLGWLGQECGSSSTTTTTNDLSHTSAFRHGALGHPVHASQPTNSPVASMAAVGSGDFAPFIDDSHASSHDDVMHRQTATTCHGTADTHQFLPSRQNLREADCSALQPITCLESVGSCDQILPSPLSESAVCLFPHQPIANVVATLANDSFGATEESLISHPLYGLENELPLSLHTNTSNGPEPNTIQPPEIENSSFLATKDFASAPAEIQAVAGSSRCARQRASNPVMPVRANDARSCHDFGGVTKMQSATLGACYGTTIDIDSSSESEATSESSVSVAQEQTMPPGVNPHLLRLVEKANASCNLPEGTLKCFLPGRVLKVINISETVRMLVPDTAEPLIAEQAIQNFPEGSLVQNTSLKHRKDSTHLIVAYNVPNGSLNCTKKDRKSHWVLVIVSILTSEIHVFGAETGFEGQAEALGNNIGMFVNNHRSSWDDHCTPLKWSKPILEPLYPFGIIPNTGSCAIAVISRVEAFFHPEKALHVQSDTGPFELAQQLNQKRSEYLRLFIDRYKCLHTTKKLYDQIVPPTIIPPKRLAMDHSLTSRSETAAKRSPQWLSNYGRPRLKSGPRLSKPELWRASIMACAEAKGFSAEGLFQAFQNAPEYDVEDVARVLQCFCEVASPGKLIMLKRLLKQEPMDPFLRKATSTSSDAESLWQLHCLISKLTAVEKPILIFKSLFCLLCYYECHEAAVSSWKKELNLGRANRKRKRDRERGRNGKQSPAKQNLSRSSLTAEQQIRALLVDRLCQAGDSLEAAQEQIRKNLQHGKRLKLLLHGRDPLWLFLILIQADGSSILHEDKTPPALNIMDFNPPTQCRRLSEPISTNELLELTEKLATWFGQSLFIARPELKDTDLSGLDIFGNVCNSLQLCLTSDKQIQGTAPEDIAKLLQRTVDEES